MYLQERVALVTGAARGIGAGIAEKLGHQGANVILIDILKEELQHTTNLLREKGLNASCFAVDVTKEDEIRQLFQTISDKYERADILVNNAGISPKHNNKRRNTHDIPLLEWEEVFKVNLTAAFLFTQNILPLMTKKNWGRIINISSLAGRTSSKIAGSHYAASKAGMIGFSRTVASEYGKYGITVNNIAPGRIETPMSEMVSEETNEKFISNVPVSKVGNVENIAGAVLYLCHKSSDYMTGSTLDVNGGIYMN